MEHPSNIQNRMITRPNKPITLFFVYFRNIAKKKKVKSFHCWKNKNISNSFPLKSLQLLQFFWCFPETNKYMYHFCIECLTGLNFSIIKQKSYWNEQHKN